MPLKAIENTIPYERQLEKRPNYEIVKAFGCLCYACTQRNDRHKFAPRAPPCLFNGYSQSQKGYKLYDFDTNLVLVSRVVQFKERYFPFHYIHTNKTVTPIFVPIDCLKEQRNKT